MNWPGINFQLMAKGNLEKFADFLLFSSSSSSFFSSSDLFLLYLIHFLVLLSHLLHVILLFFFYFIYFKHRRKSPRYEIYFLFFFDCLRLNFAQQWITPNWPWIYLKLTSNANELILNETRTNLEICFNFHWPWIHINLTLNSC